MLTQTSVQELTKNQIIHKNKWLFILTKLDLTSMVVPVIVKIWESANLSFSNMLFLQGIFALSVVIFEIPSGAISDAFKRKYVLASGYLFLAIGSLTYSLGHTFIMFAISETLFGIGLATISGSDSSLVYDTLAEFKEEKQFKSILGKASTLSFIAAMITLMVAGVIGEYSLRLPLYILTGTFVVKVILCLQMVEIERIKAKNAGSATKQAFQTLFKSKYLIAVLFAFLAYSVAQRVTFWAYQPKLFEYGITPLHIGFIFAGMNLVAAGSSYLFGKINEKHEDLMLLGFMIIEIVNTIVLWKIDNLGILSTIYLVQIARGGRAPIVGTMIQRKATSEQRATLISIYSSLGNLLYFIASVFYNLYTVSLDNSLISVLVLSLVFLVIYSTLIRSNRNGIKKIKEEKIKELIPS